MLGSPAVYTARALDTLWVMPHSDGRDNACHVCRSWHVPWPLQAPHPLMTPSGAVWKMIRGPDQVTVGQLVSFRQLMFDAQTFSAAQVKHVLSGSEAAKKAELVPAEQAQRIQAQKQQLVGTELTGPHECSHPSYDYVTNMLENNVGSYPELHRFTHKSHVRSKWGN